MGQRLCPSGRRLRAGRCMQASLENLEQRFLLNGTPELTVDDALMLEGDSGTTAMIFTVRLSEPAAQPVSVDWYTANGTAVAGRDYQAAAGTLTLAAGETSATGAVLVFGDTLDEDNETIILTLARPVGASLARQQAVLTIVDDDATPSLSIDSPSMAEGNLGTSPLVFTVSLSAPSGRTVSVDYSTAPGTAAAGSDFLPVSGTLLIAPGQTSATIIVPVIGDSLLEDNESFAVALSGAVGADIVSPVGLGTILNDDAPIISIADLSVIEGATDPDEIIVSLSHPTTQTVTVQYTVNPLTATADVDYIPPAIMPQTIVFAPGQTSLGIPIRPMIVDDRLREPDETFTIDLSNAVNATFRDMQGIVTIVDDDLPPTVNIENLAIAEGDYDTREVLVIVRLTAPSSETVGVHYQTIDGTAVAGEDYVAASGILMFWPGEEVKGIWVEIIGDRLNEANETVTVRLSDPVGVAVGTAEATLTILNDDPAPRISIADASVIEGDSGTRNAAFVVSLYPVSGQAISVNYTTVNGTADETDYVPVSGTLTFFAGETRKVIEVPVIGDTLLEGNETFSVVLSNPVGGTILDGVGLGVIRNDDPAPEIRVLLGKGPTEILDGQRQAVDFGAVRRNAAGPVRTFRIVNVGGAELRIGRIVLPRGFLLTQDLSTYTIAPGRWASFAVRLDTRSAGIFSGQIRFATTDPDENPFNFPVTGRVAATAGFSTRAVAAAPVSPAPAAAPAKAAVRRVDDPLWL